MEEVQKVRERVGGRVKEAGRGQSPPALKVKGLDFLLGGNGAHGVSSVYKPS